MVWGLLFVCLSDSPTKKEKYRSQRIVFVIIH